MTVYDEIDEAFDLAALGNLPELAKVAMVARGKVLRNEAPSDNLRAALQRGLAQGRKMCQGVTGGKRPTVTLDDVLYFSRRLPKGNYAKGTELLFFHAGQGEDRTKAGYNADPLNPSANIIDRGITNLEKEGTLTAGSVFRCHDVGLEAEGDQPEVIVEKLGLALYLEWAENNGVDKIPFNLAMYHPLRYRLEGNGAGDVERRVRWAGPRIGSRGRGGRPLFTIEGQQKTADRGYLVARVVRPFELKDEELVLRAELYGKHTKFT